MEKPFMKFAAANYRVDILLIAIVCIASFLPRLMDLGTFLTADEKTWIVRSYEFVRAFKDVRFNDMLQTTHPGVTTLWGSGLAITAKMFFGHIPFTSNALIYFAKSAQFPIALLNALTIPLLYTWIRCMSGRKIALIAALFIALDPFIIGYSRVIHVDALLGSFLTLAVVSTILYARSLKQYWLVVSAVCSGLALLTKIPAVFIVPFLPLAIAILHYQQVFSWKFFVERIRDMLLWALIIVLMILVIWPALLWVPNPAGNVLTIRRDVTIATTTPHNMLEEYSLKPFHYPAAILTRSNPVSFIGAIAGIIGIGFLMIKKKIPHEMLLLAVYLFGFVIMMTLGAKKGDRYIMPTFFALDILAAFGIIWLCSLITNAYRSRIVFISTALLSTIYLLGVVISYHPYAVAYSNPLFPDNLSQELGWGEGLDQVGAWLDKNYPNATVASWYPEELDAYTDATVLHINAHMQNNVRFVILYRNMFGREPSHYANDFIDEYYKKQTPIFVVKIHGKEFAWVYEKPTYSNSIGDLDTKIVVVQEVEINHEGIVGFDILPATRSGNADTGSFVIEVSSSIAGNALFTQSIPIKEVKDTLWYPIRFPESLVLKKGDHLFVRIRASGSSEPYASLRYSQVSLRTTSIYISRTGSIANAQKKSGSLGIRLMYRAVDGTIATENQTKLLR